MTEKEREEMERLKALERKTKARYRANNYIIKENYDRVSATLPKGTKERIKESGYSINELINKLVLEFLENNK